MTSADPPSLAHPTQPSPGRLTTAPPTAGPAAAGAGTSGPRQPRPTSRANNAVPRDPAVLLRRIGRHVPFGPDRIVVGVIRLSRSYVERAGWFDPPPGDVSEAQVREAVRACLRPLAPARAGIPATHGVAMVRCRRGRVVWLPSDELWLWALAEEAARHRLTVAETFLVTEHGWRCDIAATAGTRPALAA